MPNVPSNESARNPYTCRKCGQTIYWHKAQSGKHYPCDSATDRKAFHQCAAAPAKSPATAPLTQSYFDPEATLAERVDHLEKQVGELTRTIQAVQARQPITDQDVAF